MRKFKQISFRDPIIKSNARRYKKINTHSHNAQENSSLWLINHSRSLPYKQNEEDKEQMRSHRRISDSKKIKERSESMPSMINRSQSLVRFLFYLIDIKEEI